MTHEMIDTKRMREFASRMNSHYTGRTHFDGCEYFHTPCAILKLCDELDAANAILDQLYNQGDPDDLETDDTIMSFEEFILRAHKSIDENGA